ncbi:hypothetical protein, partial [Exiguobacterium sp. s128]|uniref:hypothetical protein n=1 Tax=Exiguobacterium sp. s128 TaxID=2751205 RepID=UPI001BE972B3
IALPFPIGVEDERFRPPSIKWPMIPSFHGIIGHFYANSDCSQRKREVDFRIKHRKSTSLHSF